MMIDDLEKWLAVAWAILCPAAVIAAMLYHRRERGRDMAAYQEKRMREINAQRIEETRRPERKKP